MYPLIRNVTEIWSDILHQHPLLAMLFWLIILLYAIFYCGR